MSFTITGVDVLRNLVKVERCKKLAEELDAINRAGLTVKDNMCPISDSIYRADNIEKLALELLPTVEQITGLKLLPTYSYSRIYRTGEVLKPHRDREACEISLTINLDQEGENWPIYMADPTSEGEGVATLVTDKETFHVSNIQECFLLPGDAVLYRGCEKIHWRLQYNGIKQTQVFVHYVDANGPNKDYKHDAKVISRTINDIKLISQTAFDSQTDRFINELIKVCETKAAHGAKFCIFELQPFISITKLINKLNNTDLVVTSSDIPNTIIVSWH